MRPRWRGCRAAVLLVFVGALGASLFWGGLGAVMTYTDRMEFCISCHEMESTVYQEYRGTAHAGNAFGVSAKCADCHVPRDWTDKLVHKVLSLNEVYHHLIGSVASRTDFEAKRMQLAEIVWAEMEASDSASCRRCHSFATMHFDEQPAEAAEAMQAARDAGATCIDCHKGLVHQLPREMREDAAPE